MREEEALHNAVCEYLRMRYSGCIFTSESSGIRVSPGLAAKMKKQRSGSGLPDLIILEPNNKYHGLCIEIKANYEKLFKKNGEYRTSEHIDKQRKVLSDLELKGYCARFGCGFDHCKKIIDDYMDDKL